MEIQELKNSIDKGDMPKEAKEQLKAILNEFELRTDTSEETVNNTKTEAVEEISRKLQEISEGETEEVYFHDIISEIIDSNTPQNRQEAIKLIDYTGNEQYADEGVLDTSSIDRYLVTMAYECLHQEVFEDDFLQELQTKLNNETINHEQAKEIIKEIEAYQEEKGFKEVQHKDSETQIYIKSVGELTKEDFKTPFFEDNQIIDLTDSIKIMASNKKANKNAIVLENPNREEFRVYVMDKSKDLDIRKHLKKEYSEKGELIKDLNKFANLLIEKY